MSEKRFILDSDFVKVTSQVVWDNQEEKGLTLMKLVNLLNIMSDEIEEVGISIKLFEDDVQIKDKKIEEQQAIVEAKDSLLSILSKENEQLRQLLEEYRKTNKHLSELCADASKNGYLPPLEDLRWVWNDLIILKFQKKLLLSMTMESLLFLMKMV
mgnify:CR=1 FL=1